MLTESSPPYCDVNDVSRVLLEKACEFRLSKKNTFKVDDYFVVSFQDENSAHRAWTWLNMSHPLFLRLTKYDHPPPIAVGGTLRVSLCKCPTILDARQVACIFNGKNQVDYGEHPHKFRLCPNGVRKDVVSLNPVFYVDLVNSADCKKAIEFLHGRPPFYLQISMFDGSVQESSPLTTSLFFTLQVTEIDPKATVDSVRSKYSKYGELFHPRANSEVFKKQGGGNQFFVSFQRYSDALEASENESKVHPKGQLGCLRVGYTALTYAIHMHLERVRQRTVRELEYFVLTKLPLIYQELSSRFLRFLFPSAFPESYFSLLMKKICAIEPSYFLFDSDEEVVRLVEEARNGSITLGRSVKKLDKEFLSVRCVYKGSSFENEQDIFLNLGSPASFEIEIDAKGKIEDVHLKTDPVFFHELSRSINGVRGTLKVEFRPIPPFTFGEHTLTVLISLNQGKENICIYSFSIGLKITKQKELSALGLHMSRGARGQERVWDEQIRNRTEVEQTKRIFDEELWMKNAGVQTYLAPDLEALHSSLSEGSGHERQHRAHLHALLWLEEREYQNKIREFDTKDAKFELLNGNQWKLIINDPTLLGERRPSLGVGDHVIAWIAARDGEFMSVTPYNEEHKGNILKVMKDCIKVEMPADFADFLRHAADDDCVCVRFGVALSDRLRFRKLHHAIDQVSDRLLCPSPANYNFSMITDGVANLSYKSITNPNEEQRKCVSTILSMCNSPNPHPPFILHGPFGTGKTVTMIEAMLQVLSSSHNSRILVCTETNSAADLFVERLHEIKLLPPGSIFRLISPDRSAAQCFQGAGGSRSRDLIDKYTFMHADHKVFWVPQMRLMLEKRIVVSTWETAGVLVWLKTDHFYQTLSFSHIIIDEAAQMLEPAALLPLCLADSRTNVIFSGDCQQIGPMVLSRLARSRGLGVSIMERLLRTQWYQQEAKLWTQLLVNYRNHADIVKLSSKLFYEGSIRSAGLLSAPWLSKWNFTPNMNEFPVMFLDVLGNDRQDFDSPSFFNVSEAESVVSILVDLLRSCRGFITVEDIQVISGHRKQIEIIRKLLRDHRNFELELSRVNVGPVESIQGREKKVVIISTVRASEDWLASDLFRDEGFVFNQKRLNSAMGRASQLLCFVGHAKLLADLSRKFYETFEQINVSGFGQRESQQGQVANKTVSSNPSSMWLDIVQYCNVHNTFQGKLSFEVSGSGDEPISNSQDIPFDPAPAPFLRFLSATCLLDVYTQFVLAHSEEREMDLNAFRSPYGHVLEIQKSCRCARCGRCAALGEFCNGRKVEGSDLCSCGSTSAVCTSCKVCRICAETSACRKASNSAAKPQAFQASDISEQESRVKNTHVSKQVRGQAPLEEFPPLQLAAAQQAKAKKKVVNDKSPAENRKSPNKAPAHHEEKKQIEPPWPQRVFSTQATAQKLDNIGSVSSYEEKRREARLECSVCCLMIPQDKAVGWEGGWLCISCCKRGVKQNFAVGNLIRRELLGVWQVIEPTCLSCVLRSQSKVLDRKVDEQLGACLCGGLASSYCCDEGTLEDLRGSTGETGDEGDEGFEGEVFFLPHRCDGCSLCASHSCFPCREREVKDCAFFVHKFRSRYQNCSVAHLDSLWSKNETAQDLSIIGQLECPMFKENVLQVIKKNRICITSDWIDDLHDVSKADFLYLRAYVRDGESPTLLACRERGQNKSPKHLRLDPFPDKKWLEDEIKLVRNQSVFDSSSDMIVCLFNILKTETFFPIHHLVQSHLHSLPPQPAFGVCIRGVFFQGLVHLESHLALRFRVDRSQVSHLREGGLVLLLLESQSQKGPARTELLWFLLKGSDATLAETGMVDLCLVETDGTEYMKEVCSVESLEKAISGVVSCDEILLFASSDTDDSHLQSLFAMKRNYNMKEPLPGAEQLRIRSECNGMQQVLLPHPC
eukprot:753886-Hanusia_phi.AAC.2